MPLRLRHRKPPFQNASGSRRSDYKPDKVGVGARLAAIALIASEDEPDLEALQPLLADREVKLWIEEFSHRVREHGLVPGMTADAEA